MQPGDVFTGSGSSFGKVSSAAVTSWLQVRPASEPGTDRTIGNLRRKGDAVDRPLCANSGRPPTAWRTGHIDPERPFEIRPVNGCEGARKRTSIVPEAIDNSIVLTFSVPGRVIRRPLAPSGYILPDCPARREGRKPQVSILQRAQESPPPGLARSPLGPDRRSRAKIVRKSCPSSP